MSEDKKEKSAKDPTWKDKVIIEVKSTGHYLREGSRIALIVIAAFFFIGASVAAIVGVIDLMSILKGVFISPGRDTVIHELIILAEHFMIAITFFAICKALVDFSIPDPKKEAMGKMGEIRNLETYIFSMVIATISVIFLSAVLAITGDLSNYCVDQLLKVGISIAAVIIALGLYSKLTKEGKERFTKR